MWTTSLIILALSQQPTPKTPWELWANGVEAKGKSFDERITALENKSHDHADDPDVIGAIEDVEKKIEDRPASLHDYLQDGGLVAGIVAIIGFLVRQHSQMKTLNRKLPGPTKVPPNHE